jgi:hypothetical protein
MTESIKDKAAEAGQKITETAKAIGHKIAEGAEKAVDWAKDKTRTDKGTCDTSKMACANVDSPTIREHMEVIAACGKHVGVVDRIQGNTVKLTKSDPAASGQHHFIPLEWVARVDHHVHLNKNSEEVFRNWKAEPAMTFAG